MILSVHRESTQMPALAWIRGLTDRIVRPPHILPLTGVALTISRRFVEDGQSCPSPRERIPEVGIWVDQVLREGMCNIVWPPFPSIHSRQIQRYSSVLDTSPARTGFSQTYWLLR